MNVEWMKPNLSHLDGRNVIPPKDKGFSLIIIPILLPLLIHVLDNMLGKEYHIRLFYNICLSTISQCFPRSTPFVRIVDENEKNSVHDIYRIINKGLYYIVKIDD